MVRNLLLNSDKKVGILPMFEGLLLQILIILFPHLLYVAIKNKILTHQHDIKIYLCITHSLSIIICMLFPITLSEGAIYDLRLIPWLLAFLYGGKTTGIIVTLVLFLTRFYIGGDGMYPVFMIFSGAGLFLIFTLNRYQIYQMKGKITYASTIMSAHLISLFAITQLLFPNLNLLSAEKLPFLSFHLLINLITLATSISLIELLIENERLNREIQAAEKMNIVGQLAASVAHEIRNPLTSIKGFLQMLEDDTVCSSKKELYINISLEELKRTDKIINNYLSLAKITPENDLEIVNIEKELHYVIDTLSCFAALHNVSITKNELERPIFIEGNREKLRQILINIVKNGIEASQSTKNAALKIRTFTHHSNIAIEIEDNGKGMSNDEVKRLGMPFYSTKEKGTGLGMMICYKLLNTMHGKMNVTSKKGKGTRFTITFPKLKTTPEQHTFKQDSYIQKEL